MDEYFKKQLLEQETKSKFKGISIRQNELKLMKAARKTKVHGDCLTKESTRELLRQIMRAFLQFGFPQSAVESISSFLPLYAWKDDIDAYAETLYVTVQIRDDIRAYKDFHITRKEFQRTEMYGPSSSGKWISLDGLTLTRNEISDGEHTFMCEEGFTPNRNCNFVSRFVRHGFREKTWDVMTVFASTHNDNPDEIKMVD